MDGLRFLRRCTDRYDLIINDSTDPFGHTEGLFTREFYGNCFRALHADGIMVYQHGSPFYEEDEAAFRAMHRKAYQSFPVSRVYQASIPTCPAGIWMFGFASKNIIRWMISMRPAGINAGLKRGIIRRICIKAHLCCRNMSKIFFQRRKIKMSKLMIIGCGGVASVAIHKVCQNDQVFDELMIASRTVSKCDALKEKLQEKTRTKITTAQIDADDTEALTQLIRDYQPDAVLNVALPYQDLTIMDACLAAGVDYIDTANYEPEDTEDPVWREAYEKRCKELGFSAYFDYSWQWAYADKYKEAGLTALLGTGFDPGVTSVLPLTPKSIISIRSIRLIFWTAMAAIMAMPLRRISIRKSICGRFLRRVLIWKTANGLKCRR